MEIIRIFDDSNDLFSFKFEGDEISAYDTLIDLWTDVSYVRNFLKENHNDLPKGVSIDTLVDKILRSIEIIDDKIIDIANDNERNLEELFKPLDNLEQSLDIVLSKQKGRESYLRIYALKIDTNCFVITGGALKFTKYMDERKHTETQLTQLDKCRNFLRDNNVIDSDSFFEFLDQD
jgi:hypothetical protein